MEEEIKRLIQEATDKKNFREIRENGLFLSDHQIEILNESHINWKVCTSLKQLIFEIENALEEEENEILADLASKLAEDDYYQNVRK